jgi:hypothetical protein
MSIEPMSAIAANAGASRGLLMGIDGRRGIYRIVARRRFTVAALGRVFG